VLQDGQIRESGPHAALMAEDGLYASLYALNYTSFDDIPDRVIQQTLEGERT